MAPISLLLVDNNPSFLRILTSFLQRYGRGAIEVVATAGGGKEALLKAQDLKPRVILIDLSMPDLHGLEAIPRLREILPGAGIIALTFLNAEGYRDAALEAGADDFISKARLDTELLPAIWRLAEGSPREPGGTREPSAPPDGSTGHETQCSVSPGRSLNHPPLPGWERAGVRVSNGRRTEGVLEAPSPSPFARVPPGSGGEDQGGGAEGRQR